MMKSIFGFTMTKKKMRILRVVLRHEIIHAFLNESGLKDNFEHTSHAGHEETMVDWIAIQFPKIATVYKELGIFMK